MVRFREEDELSNLAERDDPDVPMAEALGRSIAGYQAMAAVHPEKPGSILIRKILDELDREFGGLTDELPAGGTTAFLNAARDRLDRDARARPDGGAAGCTVARRDPGRLRETSTR